MRTAAWHGKPRTRNLPTIIAISIVAFAVANLLHEGAGHGGACLLTGGHAKVLSTVHFECSRDSRFISAGGTLVNLLAGLLCWIAIRFPRYTNGQVRYFVWLLMTVNLLQAGGYLLFSGLANFGDWADVIAGLTPVWIWRTGLTIFGAMSYVLAVWLALLELRPFLAESDWRRGGGKDLTLVPYLTGGILYTLAGIFNPVGMMLVGLSAAAASFGGTSAMAWMTQWLGSRFVPKSGSPCFILQRSQLWLITAFVAASLFIAFLGRGIRFHIE
jgi:preprotein translocase subunit SecG